jgi:predicted metal-dependent phosphoesterase TrpH
MKEHHIDAHVHTFFSSDAPNAHPELMIDAAANRGVDTVVFTDHNTAKIHLIKKWTRLTDYAYLRGVTIIPGVEWTEQWRHLLFIGVEPKAMKQWFQRNEVSDGIGIMKKPNMSLKDTLQFVLDNGGVTVVPHPGLIVGSMGFGDIRKYAEM